MTGASMILSMFKKNQYESTRDNIQGVVMLMSAIGISIAVILTALLVDEPISLYLFIGALLFIAVAYLLQKFKLVSRNFATFLYFAFLCFVYTPVNWYVAGGMHSATPYIAVIVMLAVMISLSGKMQQRLKITYLVVLAGLIVYSALTTSDETLPMVIYKSVAFIVAMTLMVYYMTYMFKKYDEMQDQFLSSSIKDELTRVLSRRVLDVIIQFVEYDYIAKGIDYVMIMFDVDKFKKLNDEHGHVVGDIVLRNVARCIKENTREEDFLVRYGGDEFLMILKGVTDDRLQKILRRITQKQICKKLLGFEITVSSGFAKRSECDAPYAVIELADQRMYKDKETHR